MLIVHLRRPPAWKELYELQIVTMMLLLGFVPTVGTAIEWLGSSALLPVASLYGGVLLFVQRRAIDWKCPRCRRAFLRTKGNGFALPFRSHCGNCGLRRGALSIADYE